MRKTKEITVLVAVMNKEGTIRDCIESLLKLDNAPAKIMVIDGYSSDGTYEILKEYEGKIEISQFPANLSKTFNWALDKIETEYVTFTDGDCVVSPGWLTELLKGFEEENVVATASPVRHSESRVILIFLYPSIANCSLVLISILICCR